MKVVERIFEHGIWQQIDVGDMQFGFMKGKGQMQEKFRAKGKKLYFTSKLCNFIYGSPLWNSKTASWITGLLENDLVYTHIHEAVVLHYCSN